MNASRARQIGCRSALQIQVLAIVLWQVFYLFQTTHDNFYNGLFYFMRSQTDPRTWGFFGLQLVLTYIFGRKAGEAILQHPSLYVRIAARYALAVTLISLVYLGGLASWLVGWRTAIEPVLVLGCIMLFNLLLVWLWACKRVQQKIILEPQQEVD